MSIRSFAMLVGPGGLWSSIGTAATTHQVTGFGGEESAQASDFITFNPNLDVNGSLAGLLTPGDETLFAATDAGGHTNLWSSNGTGAGSRSKQTFAPILGSMSLRPLQFSAGQSFQKPIR